VVAGIDFSSASLAAARWAIDHVAPQSDAIVAHIVPSPNTLADDGRLDRAELRDRLAQTPALRGGLGGFVATLDVASARAVVRIGRASHWLSVLTAELGASLLVLGRRADSLRRGIGEPNVLERSARRTQASVLVVPEGTAERPHHIIAAIDRSAAADHVLRVGRALARMHGCAMIVLHVAPTIEAYDRVIRSTRGRGAMVRSSAPTAPEPDSQPHVPQWIIAVLERHAASAELHRVRIATGDPAREIVAATEQHEAPLIVVGKRGDDGFPVGGTGSVARELLTRAPFPVLAVGEAG
jgi:nucleotide-binding universal stress UspA family protein